MAPDDQRSAPARHGATIRPWLRHAGACGTREVCWRPACRDDFGDLRTVETIASPRWVVIARCHDRVYVDQLALRADRWTDGAEAAA